MNASNQDELVKILLKLTEGLELAHKALRDVVGRMERLEQGFKPELHVKRKGDTSDVDIGKD